MTLLIRRDLDTQLQAGNLSINVEVHLLHNDDDTYSVLVDAKTAEAKTDLMLFIREVELLSSLFGCYVGKNFYAYLMGGKGDINPMEDGAFLVENVVIHRFKD